MSQLRLHTPNCSRHTHAVLSASLILFFCVSGASARPPDTERKLVIIVSPLTDKLVSLVKSISRPTAVLVLRPRVGQLQSEIRSVQRAAASRDGTLLSLAVNTLADTLGTAGLRPQLLLQFDETIVVSSFPVPIDVLPFGGRPLGLLTQISHVIVSDRPDIREQLDRSFEPKTILLKRTALLAVAELPQGLHRADHDIIKAAVELSDLIPTDIVIAPTTKQSEGYLTDPAVQILHIDTHGTADSIQLGAREEFLPQAQLPRSIGPAFVLAVGCETGSSRDSIGPLLVARGATAVVGMAFIFRSGGPSGGDISDPAFYNALWIGLVKGETVGRAMLDAKQTLPSETRSAGWLLFGNGDLRFNVEEP